MAPIHVLIVDDSEDDALLIVTQLRRDGIELTYECVQNGPELAGALARRPPDAVISDYNMPSFSAQDALRILREDAYDGPFILVSGAVGEETAAAVMKAGAHDFVLKDRLTRLVPALQRELREARERRQRRAAESALHESEQRFRLLAEHARDIIFRYRLEPDAALDYISPAVAALTGYLPEELYADPALVFTMVEPPDRARFQASWRSPDPPPVAVRWRRRDGQVIWMEQRAVGIRDEAGRLVAVEGILRDITLQVLADLERERLDRELRHSERLDSLGRLAGGIAHDFNNLLAVILHYASDIAETLTEQHPCHQDLLKIGHAADRAAALTRQLLIFSRLEPSLPETLDLNAVVADVEHLLRRTIGEDIEFLTALQPGLHPVTVDRTKIEQVIVNLVMNARAAMPEGGQLTIRTANTGPDDTGLPGSLDRPSVCVTVSDTGTGMAPEVAQRAFEPFFTTKGPGQGTGLGLSTAYGAITEAGGDIALSSRLGAGTTLQILLPAADQPLTGPDDARRDAPSGAGQHVLVVEDEDAVRGIVLRILTKAGYRVMLAATPKDALELCRNPLTRVDVLLTDVIMPEMSGPQLVEHVRKVRPTLPVLLMSGYTAGSFPGGRELADDMPLIRKPFNAAALLQHLQRVLDG